MTPSLTVIMPVRNNARCLEPALASLERQTDRDFVLHVWDDGSDDDSPSILKRWLNARLPGRVVGRRRVGIGRALAQLVESAPTELIARMDADDLCDPQRFERQRAYMNRHPDVAVLGTQARRVEGEPTNVIDVTDHPTSDAAIRWQMRLQNPLNHPTVMMRKSAVLNCGNYRDLRPGQDDDLWLRLSQQHRFANLPGDLLTYREHDNTVTARQKDATRTFRKRRLAESHRVFPGLPVADARRLTHLLTHPDELGVTRRDIALLERAAERLAACSGEPAARFKQTRAYRAQHLNLRTRHWKGKPIIGRAWPVMKHGLRIARHATGRSPKRVHDTSKRGAA